MTKSIGVICCGCNRMMGVDHKPIRIIPGGEPRAEFFAWFESKKLADEAAKKAGWRAEDGNHRCPDCVKKRKASAPSPRVGGYVDLAMFHRGRI